MRALLLTGLLGWCEALSPAAARAIHQAIPPVVSRPALMSAMPPTDGQKELSPLDRTLVRLGMKTEEECAVPVEGDQSLMDKIKCAGRAGIISYTIWEVIFWFTAIPIASAAYYQASGAWPDFSVDEDKAKVAASVFAFVNLARLVVPLRIGLALSPTPWVDENIVKK